MDEKMKEIESKFQNLDFYATYKINGGDLYYIISTVKELELKQEKECKRLNNENWELKQKNAGLRNYINFKSLGEEFDNWSR